MTAKRFPVEAGHIALFARALGDESPAYRDGRFAPPTFTQASQHFDPDFPLRPRPGVPWFGSAGADLGARPPGSEGGGIGLHAEQRFEYHRALRAGETLTWSRRSGASYEKEGRRGGRLRFQEHVTEFRDAAGELVVTAVTVAVHAEKTVGEDG